LASMRSPDGKILVEGFYDAVAPLSASERADIAAVPFNKAAYEAQLGVDELFGESAAARVHEPDDLYAALGGHIRRQQMLELDRRLRRHGVAFAQLDEADLAAELVSRYLNVKKRQLL